MYFYLYTGLALTGNVRFDGKLGLQRSSNDGTDTSTAARSVRKSKIN